MTLIIMLGGYEAQRPTLSRWATDSREARARCQSLGHTRESERVERAGEP